MAEADKAPEAQQLQPQDPQPLAQQPAALSSIPLRTNAVAEIIAGDHLKGMLNKTANKGVYKPFISKFVPRANHSPFGDFPKEFLKQKSKQEDFSIDIYEKSQAASASSI